MTETITESFCERCGARYSLEPPARRHPGGIGRVRVLTRGLRNYVANDGMPMAEAMAAARQDEERSSLTQQLDVFHQTFNFCLGCRQYTCASCWNEKAGECLTCAPDLSREVLPPAFPDLPAGGPQAEMPGPVEATAWPRIDLDRAPGDGNGVAPAESQPPVAPVVPAAPTPPAALAAEPADALATAAHPAPLGAEPPEALVAASPAVPPAGELTADELAAVELALAASQATAPMAAAAASEGTVPEVVEGAAAEVEAPAEAIAEAAATEVEAAAAPEAAAPEAAPEEAVAPEAVPEAAEAALAAAPDDRAAAGRRQTRSLLGRFRPGRQAPPLEPPAGATAAAAQAAAPPPAPPVAPAPTAFAPRDSVEQPTWRVTAPDATPGAPPAWPETPAWPATPLPPPQAPPAAASPWAARLATSRPEAGVWAASSQEVLGAPAPGDRAAAPAVQSCVSCGLSLSANARFCRRCGSRQA